MNDCPNAEMRDLLPELLHDRLSAAVRATVTAHVEACVDCREELELLRELRDVMMVAYTPKVNVAYVVNALPAPPAQVLAPAVRGRTWGGWRVAAAVALLAAGGTSVAVLNRDDARGTVVPVPMASTVVKAEAASNRVESTAVAIPEAEVAMAGLSDLDDSQLSSLIEEIEGMRAVPIAEPEAVMLRVGLRDPGSDE